VRRRLVSAICVVFCLCGATEAAPARAHVRLAFNHGSEIPAAIRRAAIAEAARIWLPYGIVVEGDDALAPPCDGRIVVLAIETDALLTTGHADDVLGSVRFAPDGSPDSTISLYYGNAVRLAASAALLDADALYLPASVRDQAVARTVGRALAHEVGHVLLRWQHHSSAGLMQPEQHTSTLAARGVGQFRLTPMEVSRLAAALAFGDAAGRGCPAMAAAPAASGTAGIDDEQESPRN
jgi:hypothetical protein